MYFLLETAPLGFLQTVIGSLATAQQPRLSSVCAWVLAVLQHLLKGAA